MKVEILGMYELFFSSCATDVTILALVYVNSPLERSGEGGQGHIKRRESQRSGKWSRFVLEGFWCYFFECCFSHGEKQYYADVVVKHFLMALLHDG